MSNASPLTWSTSNGCDVDASIGRVESVAFILSQTDCGGMPDYTIPHLMGMVIDEIQILRAALRRGGAS